MVDRGSVSQDQLGIPDAGFHRPGGIQLLQHPGQFLFHEVPGGRLVEEVRDLFRRHQVRDPVHHRQGTEEGGDIHEPGQVHRGLAVVGGRGPAQPQGGLPDRLRKAGMLTVGLEADKEPGIAGRCGERVCARSLSR